MPAQSNRPARTAQTLLVLAILAGVAVRMTLAFVPGYIIDQIPWAEYAKYIVKHGLGHVYELTRNQPHLGIYPPAYHAVLALLGFVYQRFFSSDFQIPSRSLLLLLKLVPITGDFALGLVIYFYVRRTAGSRSAIFATMLYMLNPAIIFTSAYWGMFGDSLYTLCVVLSFIALYYDRTNLSAAAIMVALAIKPQALAFVPLVIYGTVRFTSISRWLSAVAAAGSVVGLIWLPFIWEGTVGQTVYALRRTVGLFPVLAANAHNAWFLLSRGNSWTSDNVPMIGPATARMLGMGAFGMACLLGLWALGRPARNKQLFAIAAYTAFAFFILLTEMHENYLYPAVTLVILACWQSRLLRFFAMSITITSLVNMALNDPVLTEAFRPPAATLLQLSLLNSAINVALFAVWTGSIVRGAYVARGSSTGSEVGAYDPVAPPVSKAPEIPGVSPPESPRDEACSTGRGAGAWRNPQQGAFNKSPAMGVTYTHDFPHLTTQHNS